MPASPANPIDPRLHTAAAIFRQNSGMLGRVLTAVTGEQWLRAPSGACNPPLWILGHVVWTRSRLFDMLGSPWQRDWFAKFARGTARPAPEAYPPHEEIVAAWQESGPLLTAALESANAETLSRPNNPPSIDGTFAGMIDFLAVHETYHIGQLSYACRWLGLDRAFG